MEENRIASLLRDMTCDSEVVTCSQHHCLDVTKACRDYHKNNDSYAMKSVAALLLNKMPSECQIKLIGEWYMAHEPRLRTIAEWWPCFTPSRPRWASEFKEYSKSFRLIPIVHFMAISECFVRKKLIILNWKWTGKQHCG